MPTYPNGAWEHHEHLIDESPMKPLRVYLHVGERDLGYDAPASGLHDWVLANEACWRRSAACGITCTSASRSLPAVAKEVSSILRFTRR